MSMIPTAPPQRYHPAQVVLHWAIAALILITAVLAMGQEASRAASCAVVASPWARSTV